MQQRGRWSFVEQGEKMGGLTALLHFLESSPDAGSCCLSLPASSGTVWAPRRFSQGSMEGHPLQPQEGPAL